MIRADQLTPGDFGTLVGGAVHDVAQTVATASTHGDEALTAAIVVKLTASLCWHPGGRKSPSAGDAALPWRPTIEAMTAYCLLLAVGVWRLASGVSLPSDQLIPGRVVPNPGGQI